MEALKYLLLIFLIGCESAPIPDSAMAAIEGGDATVLIEGCGNQLNVGYTYCRMTEGEAAGKNLWLVGPTSNCERDACVFFRISAPNGEVVYGSQLPKNKNRINVDWTKLIKKPAFQVSDRGLWGVIMEVYWQDSEGRERRAISEGEIRLRVLTKNYKPLHEVENDPNFVWVYTEQGVTAKLTTGLRAYVSRKK